MTKQAANRLIRHLELRGYLRSSPTRTTVARGSSA